MEYLLLLLIADKINKLILNISNKRKNKNKLFTEIRKRLFNVINKISNWNSNEGINNVLL